MIQPPKMSPCWLTSAGIGTTRSTGLLLGRVTGSSDIVSGRSRRSSCRRFLRLVAQLAPQDLADVGLRQLGAELDVARHLVAGEVRRGSAAARPRRSALASFFTTKSFTASPDFSSGTPTAAHSSTPRMHRDHALDLVRIHVEAGHQDHVLLAVDDRHEAALVHHADVAGREPAVARRSPSPSRPAAASSPPSPAGRGCRSRRAARAARPCPRRRAARFRSTGSAGRSSRCTRAGRAD